MHVLNPNGNDDGKAYRKVKEATREVNAYEAGRSVEGMEAWRGQGSHRLVGRVDIAGGR